MGIEVSTGKSTVTSISTGDLHRTLSLARTMNGASWRVVGSAWVHKISRWRKNTIVMGVGQNPHCYLNCSGMNIHSPAILGFTQYTGFDP